MVLVVHFGEKEEEEVRRRRRLLGFSPDASRFSIIHLLAKKPKIAYSTMIWCVSVVLMLPEAARRAHIRFA